MQGWISKRDDPYPSHFEALAYLLNACVSQDWQGSYETELVTTLSFLTVRTEAWLANYVVLQMALNRKLTHKS